MKKVLFLTDHPYYDRVHIDILKKLSNGDINVEVYDNPDFVLTNTDKLDEYDFIITTMFLPVGQILELDECHQGVKTGVVLLSKIKDKINKTKCILMIESVSEIDEREYKWCKENGVIVVNNMVAKFDTLYNIIESGNENHRQ